MIQLLHYRKLPVLSLCFALLFMGGTAMAQKTWTGAAGDNLWETAGNWSLGGFPTTAPTAGDAVLINTNATVRFTLNRAAASLTIANNAVVTFQPNAAASAILTLSGTGNVLDVQSGSTLTLTGFQAGGGSFNMTLNHTATAPKTGTIAGTMNVNVQPGGGVNDEGVFSATNSVTTVTGSLRNGGGTILSSAANLVIGGTGTYVHATDGDVIATASWNFGSTANVTGVIATVPTGLNQAYTNLIWNCAAQTGTFALFAGNNFPTTIAGNLTINSTGTGSLAFTNNPTNRNVLINGNFTQTGGTLIIDNTNGGSSLEVDGATTLSGTQNLILTAGSGNARLITNGPFSMTGGTLTMSSTGGQGFLNASGNFSHTGGTITETSTGSGRINFIGTTSQLFTSGAGTVSGAINYDVANGAILQMAAASTVVASSGGTFTLNTGATLGIRSADGLALSGGSGNIQVAGLRDYSPTANYTYNGTAAQNTGDGIPLNLSGTLTIANTAGVTLNNPESIGSGGTVALQTGTFATGTNLTLNTVSTIRRISGSVTGTFAGTGDYDVVYEGSGISGPELQGGQAGATRLRNLTMNITPSSSFVSLTALTEIKGVLTMTSGKLTTTGANILQMTATATCPAGGSPASYVNGPIRKIGTAAFIFPIGNGVGANANYRPAAISGSGASIGTALSATATITATVSLANPLKIFNTIFQPDLLSLTNCLWWDITRGDAGVNNVFMWLSTGDAGPSQTINYISACYGGTPTGVPTPSLLRVAHYVGGQWTSLGNASQVQQANAWFIGAGTGIATFSPFSVGSAESILPVTFTSFTGLKDAGSVRLNWETSSEQNSAYFDVERSADGVNFSSIGKVNAAGNSATLRKYSFTDNNPATGRNFYRLRQVDLDAQFEYSKTISVNMAANAAVTIYPNPVQSNMMVEYPKVGKGAIYKVVSVDGRVMQSGVLQENSSQQNINLGNLQRGNYILLIQNDGQQYVQKIQKQ
jgi:hypothetical protein